MTLGKRQLQCVLEIFNDEARKEEEASVLSRKLNASSRLRETLMFEASSEFATTGVFVSDTNAELVTPIEDLKKKIAEDVDKLLYKKLSSLLQAYGGDKITSTTLRDDLSDFDAEAVYQAQESLKSDLESAIKSYIDVIASYCEQAKLMRQDESD